jgi:Transient receptor potential (TRP) ion channel
LDFINGSAGNQLGCLKANFSNGVTAKHAAVSWLSGILTLGLAAAVGILAVVGGSNMAAVGPNGNPGNLHAPTAAPTHSGPPAGHTDPITLLLHFQSISSTGLLSLRYPLVYHTFTINFAWANFILPISSLRKAASHLRKCDMSGSDAGIPVVSTGISEGIVNYSSELGISEQDIFGLVYLVFMCACATLLGLYLIAKAVVHVMVGRARDGQRRAVWEKRSHTVSHMASNNALRLVCDGHSLYCC